MAHPHDFSPCSQVSSDPRFGALSITDVSEVFGAGAVELCCPCGEWVVEDSFGVAVARPEFASAF